MQKQENGQSDFDENQHTYVAIIGGSGPEKKISAGGGWTGVRRFLEGGGASKYPDSGQVLGGGSTPVHPGSPRFTPVHPYLLEIIL